MSPTLRGVSVVAAAGVAVLAGSATLLARSTRERAMLPAATDSAAASALFAAVRGATPLECSLIGNALENHWGRPSLGGPDVSLLDSAQAADRAWATSNGSVDDILPMLRRMMADPSACVRRTAASLAGRVRSVKLATALASELSSSAPQTREAAVLALGYAAQSGTSSALVGHVTDTDVSVRRLVAWALGRSDDRAVIKPLTDMLRDTDGLVRVNAALGLGALEARDAIPALARVLASDSDPRARRAAAAALGQMN